MNYIALLFFILGMITYNFIPKDFISKPSGNIVPEAKAVYADEAHMGCITYEFNPAQFAICSK